ncbi:hypothetical protein LRQ11_12020 [Pseudomonas sp. MAFF 311095]|uniref:Uncharacterized protein n=1 Tax=Pseudomonas petroselini TaxID=2899822 RepID=A0ABS8QXX7_9PSED|nr:hypothetical protein [Pseudomonas petroselini]MCD7040486.1 hypothetical protein [Pseudomonas petroselini]MCD7046815.1 hypothetical protein [Pseudomonas petroselini]MCD7069116.1 hypothetical protein [Pseudomonas petroselini]MCD7079542.1 hypothetical protein [Pseudomonas petroselini]
MLSAINHSLGNIQYTPLQQDDAEPQRKKRSTDAMHTQAYAADAPHTAANDRPRKNGGGLDSLGQGNIL